ncbi:energy-coupling factor transporter ATPase [Salisediminibacterium selenitireducens]|uniref:ABC transporter related protein n=1 Tax=Bacillus selenitireducens (strain ATCC 700615 / DSM 15326 / MLS10) TaxID=439292 RepID=D6XVS0_BACIE|nr:energy-coupling factor transporter ATPase [Salisediminibacterium selenitireducens]ADH97693.1 ABC transporter related protein [[Bacillus] selenitireducens MLS10]
MDRKITVDHVYFKYADDSPDVLRDVSLTIKDGEWVTILGPNGSGKSTLARLFNALILPDRGAVTSLGIDTADEKHWPALRRQVGMVFQNPDNQLVAPTVADDVAFGLENAGIPLEEMKTRVKESIATFGLSGLENAEPHRLSGGQKQRVAIAGVMALAPDVIIFDEATSMLDPEGKREVWAAMDKLRKDQAITLISITHDVSEAVKADRVIVMHEGGILKEGTPASVLGDQEVMHTAKLKPPFPQTVAAELLKAGIDVPESILTEEELIKALWTSM